MSVVHPMIRNPMLCTSCAQKTLPGDTTGCAGAKVLNQVARDVHCFSFPLLMNEITDWHVADDKVLHLPMGDFQLHIPSSTTVVVMPQLDLR